MGKPRLPLLSKRCFMDLAQTREKIANSPTAPNISLLSAESLVESLFLFQKRVCLRLGVFSIEPPRLMSFIYITLKTI